jgi:hypothetical protein
VVFILVAVNFIGLYFSPETGASPGSVGNLFLAALFVVVAAPFGALTFVLAAPLITDDPRFRNADR